MRLPWIATCFLLGSIVVLDPTPVPAQFGRKGGDFGGKRGDFGGKRGDFGGKRMDFGGYQAAPGSTFPAPGMGGYSARSSFTPGGPTPAMAVPVDKPAVFYGPGGTPADGAKPTVMLSTSGGGPNAYQFTPGSGGFGGDRPFSGGGTPGGFGGGGFGGGGPPGGPRNFDPASMWDRMSRGRDSIDLNDPENSRMRGMMERFGTPIPANGILTKDTYMAEAQKRMASMGMSSPGGAPGAASFVNMSGSMSPDGRMSFSPSFGGSPNFSGPGGFNGPGGFGGDRDRDRGLERLREQDRDNDGRVSRAEADRQLQPNFDRIDRDNDGYITLEEYRAYYASRENDRDRNRDMGGFAGNSSGGGWGGGDMGGWANRQDSRGGTEESRPVAIRYGHLPKDLPEWFHEYDTTKDGQIALHEWIKGAKVAGEDPSVEAFAVYDLNGDGLITADEVIRHGRLQADAKRIAAIQDGESTRPSFAGPGGGRSRSFGGPPGTKGSNSDSAASTERGSGKRDRDPEKKLEKFEKRSENSDKPVRGEKSEQSPGSNGPWGNGGKKSKG